MTKYLNPWFRDGRPEYGPREYQTDVEPQEYRGFLIYRRTMQVWDIVKDGACVGQYAGPNGARRFIDKQIEATQ